MVQSLMEHAANACSRAPHMGKQLESSESRKEPWWDNCKIVLKKNGSSLFGMGSNDLSLEA
jgi:hypothetical protein